MSKSTETGLFLSVLRQASWPETLGGMMKKISILLFAIFFVCPATGLFLSQKVHGAEASDFSATLTDFMGEVSIQKPEEEIWLPVEKNMPLEEGDLLKTGPGAYAEVLIDDGSVIKVEENTEIAFDELNAGYETKRIESTIFLEFGRLIANIVRFTFPGSRFEIETPTMVAGVRGTEFIVETAGSEQTDVGVFEGEVSVAGFDEQGDVADESEILLRKWTQTTVVRGRRPLKPVTLKRAMLLHQKKVALLKTVAAKRRLALKKIINNRALVHSQVLKKWKKFKMKHPGTLLKPKKKIKKPPRIRRGGGRR